MAASCLEMASKSADHQPAQQCPANASGSGNSTAKQIQFFSKLDAAGADLFNETSGTGLQSSITAFFNSLQQLSTNPSNTSLRQAVLTAAQNVAQNFNSTSSSLTSLQQNVDQSVTQSVSQINSLTSQIAQLNGEVSAATSPDRMPERLWTSATN